MTDTTDFTANTPPADTSAKKKAKSAAATAKNKVASAKDKVANALPDGDTAAKVRDDLAKVPEHVGELASAAGDHLQQFSDDATAFVRRNPGYAIAGAVGVGVLLGLLAKKNS